jgi:hypothetical protein
MENDNIDWDLVSKQLEIVRCEIKDKYKNIYFLFYFSNRNYELHQIMNLQVLVESENA